jgi:hypothetical protein
MPLETPSPKNFIGSTDKTFIERRNRVISALFYGNVSDIIKKYFVALKEHIGNRDLKNDLIADLGSCGNEDMCMATLKDFIATHNLMVYVVENDAERQTLPNEQLLFGSRNFKNKFILAAALEQSYDTGGVETEKLEDCIVLFENNTEVLNDVISDINEIKKNNKINDIREHIVYLSTSSDDKIYLVGEPSIRTSKRRTRSPRRKSSSRPSSLRITRGGGSYKKRSYSKTRRNRVKK